jgi:pantoate kinase
MANIFVNATTARRDTRNNSIIHSEIRSIEAAVLANIDAGVLYANVTSNTTMTDSNVYYNVYNGVTNDATKLDQVNYVKDYFTGLGYGVSILTNTTTEDTITWNISW